MPVLFFIAHTLIQIPVLHQGLTFGNSKKQANGQRDELLNKLQSLQKTMNGLRTSFQYIQVGSSSNLNKTKDWALVQNAVLAIDIRVIKLG